jgi:hypothetical protein
MLPYSARKLEYKHQRDLQDQQSPREVTHSAKTCSSKKCVGYVDNLGEFGQSQLQKARRDERAAPSQYEFVTEESALFRDIKQWEMKNYCALWEVDSGK